MEYSSPVTNKQMTINFVQAGITSAYLFNAIISNMNLSTNTLEPCVIENESIELV